MSAGKKIWNVTWRLLVCLLLLGWIFHAIFTNEAKLAAGKNLIQWEQLTKLQQWEAAWKLGPPELWHTLASVELTAFAVSVLLVGITILLGVMRWRMVLEVQGLHLPFVRALEISLVAQCFNSFLLGSTGGDLMKAYYAARETHHKKTEAVTTVFVDRLIGLWSMLFFAALMMLPNWPLLARHELLAATSVLILAMLGGCSAVLTIAFWGGISRRWPAAREWLRKMPKGELLERSLDSCRQFGTHRGFLINASLISLALNVVCVLQAMVLARGLHLDIAPLALFVIVPIIICISALPITPSGLGIRENLFVGMLAVQEIHVPHTPALSLSLLVYAGSLCWSILGGIVYLCLKDRQHLEEITEGEPTEDMR
jgi:uncharacterized protein (TIRG00374 family)